MSRTIQNLKDVVDWGLCTGCGACAYACSKNGVRLVNVENVGIRPTFVNDECAACGECLAVCPGYTVDSALATGTVPKSAEADHEFGPVLEIWEGFASDPEVRMRASSGGLLTALSLYCLEREGMASVLHTGQDPEKPWLNKTVQSRGRSDLLQRTGSRYAPASPCDGLRDIENSSEPCVFVGKPCDTTGAMLARQGRPALDQKLGLVLAFFCAGTPSTKGSRDLVSKIDVPLESLSGLRYRGDGWPGRFRAWVGGEEVSRSFSYQESWGHLQAYRPMRCQICPDGLGRVADISCGDAWEQFEGGNDPGRSIVLVRTERGRQVLHRAMDAGYVTLTRVGTEAVMAAQVNLLTRRREIFGRLLARKLLMIPIPNYIGFSLFRSWAQLPLPEKLRTVFGSLTRLVQRNLWRRQPLKVNG